MFLRHSDAFLVCDTGTSVADIDRASRRKAEFSENVLHDLIVPMGINTQVRTNSETVFRRLFYHSGSRSVASNTVDNAIRASIVRPFSVFDTGVCGIISDTEKESSADFSGDVIGYYVTVTGGDIRLNVGLCRSGRAPLIRIPGAPHELTGV